MRDLIDLARSLEGLTRNAGKHAGGVVIAPSLLTDFAPLFGDDRRRAASSRSSTRTTSRRSGLVKFDFLGLRTLTIIDWAVKTINAQRARAAASRRSTSATLPLDDAATYDAAEALRDHRGVPARIARHEGPDQRACSPTASRTSSRWSRCSVPARCSRAWSTTSSTASTAGPTGRSTTCIPT